MEYKLEYLVDDEQKVFYLTKEKVLIGKLPENDIELKDNTVSRQHCQLQRAGKSFKLSDMKSTNGCFVNGQRVQHRMLEVGDKITVGRTVISFLTVSKEESYRDSSDQKISLMVPIEQLMKAEMKPKAKSAEPSFLASLTDLGKSLIASQNIEDSFQKLGDLIFKFVHPEKIFIFYYDDKQNDIHLKYTYAQPGKKDDIVNISKTIALKAIHEKVAILSSNTRNDSRFDSSKSIFIYGITSAISVPIWAKDSIYGLIYVDTSSIAHVFSEKDLEIMSIIANFAGFSIEGINSQEKLSRERRLRARLERYHSPAVVSRLMEFQDSNTGEVMPYRESEATVLFMDIVKFTSRAEKMTPIEVGIFLNNFFTEMTEIIFKNSGTLDKFIGDAIMALFGIPLEFSNHAELALVTALEMMKKLQDMNDQMTAENKIHVRIGIHSGKLISGDFGSPKRLDYTVLGNTVNIASRLESSVAGSDEIVVAESTYLAAGVKFDFELRGEKKLHGISKPVNVYRLLGKKGDK
ncbi:MAG: FHA domain-containing protein [Candidatus Aminicenantes bacterium]|nr:FHA domain-containing protein [Candidatus Aminicenantes bacterium]